MNYAMRYDNAVVIHKSEFIIRKSFSFFHSFINQETNDEYADGDKELAYLMAVFSYACQ